MGKSRTSSVEMRLHSTATPMMTSRWRLAHIILLCQGLSFCTVLLEAWRSGCKSGDWWFRSWVQPLCFVLCCFSHVYKWEEPIKEPWGFRATCIGLQGSWLPLPPTGKKMSMSVVK